MKIIVLAPSAGGKSTLMRYLRHHTKLNVAEMDEEIVKANNNKWPSDDDYKNQVLVPKITKEIIEKDEVTYFTSYIPIHLVQKAKDNGFRIILLNLSLEQLIARNTERMKSEGYDDASRWFEIQLKGYKELQDAGLIDEVFDADIPTNKIADHISGVT